MAQKNVWAAKVLALLQCRNVSGAVAQIKVAPSVKDLRMLRSALAQTGLAGRWPDAETAIDDNIAAMSAPRLHRSP